MLSLVDIRWPHWVGFIIGILFCLALDLGVFHRHARVVKVKEAMAWTTLWVSLSLLFAAAVWHWRGAEEGKEFLTGYIIELSLSMDNVFVIALIFSFFRIPRKYNTRCFSGHHGSVSDARRDDLCRSLAVEKFDWV
jgi:tellurite resistance protein TerC